MHNEIFKIGPIVVHGYGLMMAIGVLCAFYMAEIRAQKFGLERERIMDFGLYSLIGGLIGTRILYYIVEIKDIIHKPSLLLDFTTGYVVYGGIIFGVLTGYLYSKAKKLEFVPYFDLIMPSVALAQGFGRIGCFLAGCCYGKRTDSVIGVVFKNSQMAPNGVKLIPTQLFSSAGDFLIALILITYAKRDHKEGQVGGLYLILYSVGRFAIEFFRDDYRGSIGFLSTSQFISIMSLIIGIIVYHMNRWRAAGDI